VPPERNDNSYERTAAMSASAPVVMLEHPVPVDDANDLALAELIDNGRLRDAGTSRPRVVDTRAWDNLGLHDRGGSR